MKKVVAILSCLSAFLLVYSQETADTAVSTSSHALLIEDATLDSILTIYRELEDIDVVQDRSARFIEQDGTHLTVSMNDVQKMPKFFGVSDPIRYTQSLAGITTNGESRTGVYMQGCDDYQSLVAINGAPVHYPNHLLGLYSTFIPPHFSQIHIETSVHRSNFTNRLGGMIAMQTQSAQPKRFGAEGSIGVIASDATLTIPCGKKSALWLSGRASYITPIFGRYLSVYGANLGYDFQDGNITFATHPTEKDDIVLTAFVSHDKAQISMRSSLLGAEWYNAVGSGYWNHSEDWLNFRSTLSASGYTSTGNVGLFSGEGNERVGLATGEWKNQLDMELREDLTLRTGLDYTHYWSRPMRLEAHASNLNISMNPSMEHSNELSLYADVRHEPFDWLNYSVGVRATGNIIHKKFFGALDPRITIEFTPAEDHHIFIHGGVYHQYTHKVALLDGGLPADFHILADEKFAPERAHSVSLSYQTDFIQKKYSASSTLYFKQLYGIVESNSNVFALVNQKFDYMQNLIVGDGRNWGWDVMLQRNRGFVTGYIAYSLSWSKCKLPQLEGFQDYRYSASHERRHDLKVVLNSQVHKKVNLGAQFVLASGIPYTAPKEMYMIGGEMVCNYASYNTSHLPLYHRLDLTCNYDIIKRNGHLFGINVSLYNVYNRHNAQYVIYRQSLQPSYGSMISRIIPSISFYGKW